MIPLSPGDSLVLVTDGFKCANPEGQMLGMAKLAEFVRVGQVECIQQFIAEMHKLVLDFSQGEPQNDDLTAVVIKRR